MGVKLILSAVLVCGTLCLLASTEPIEDKYALLDFIRYINHSRRLNWNERTSAWVGVTCNHISSFSGNDVSLQPSSASSPKPLNKKHSSKFNQPAILGIFIGSCVAAFVAIALLWLLTTEGRKMVRVGRWQKAEKTTRRMGSQHQEGDGRIIFFEGCNLIFDLEDLLRASAEVLGDKYEDK